MNTVDSVVRSVIQDFVRDGVLFTALDVSNKVKETLPLARHREVRDLVRMLYTSEIETAGYARTPITVTLENGDKTEALLYHPLADSWDLDAKYDAQKRAQTATQPIAIHTQFAATHASLTPSLLKVDDQKAVQAAVDVISNPANLSIPVINIPLLAKPQPAPKVVANSNPTPAAASSRVLWDNLFKGQPSLFPRK